MVLVKPQPFNGTHGAAANSFQPGLMAFNVFLEDFKSSFFDHNFQHRAEVALQSLRQTGTVSAYTQELRLHCWMGHPPLMSHYHHGLEENIQLAVLMSNIQFTSLQTMQAMALKAGQTIEGIWNGQPAPSPLLAPVPQPPTPMQWSPNHRSQRYGLGFPTWSTQPSLTLSKPTKSN
ncbi:uncharacterized protein VP01_1572g2 [Puccinia sorghi]|uniref:Retrotransposon gag domain-containing protein n=1 Tax=Puccinia sorghi TaxID=27349 RepID=A0A0L6VHR0_9BASI|nr:uncharacterized protein VP01_1572g2 [Puccinia sorghi]